MKHLYILLSRLFFSIVYCPRYLHGKWFDGNVYGWKMCWKFFWLQKIRGFNRHVPFPVCPFSSFGKAENITFALDNIDNFWKNGVYFQSWNGHITIGEGTWIAPGVGLITENHDPKNLEKHLDSKDIVIGKNCWIGMNSVILPGVVLGDSTIVGAGAVVTKSFPQGNVTLAGVPAKEIRRN